MEEKDQHPSSHLRGLIAPFLVKDDPFPLPSDWLGFELNCLNDYPVVPNPNHELANNNHTDIEGCMDDEKLTSTLSQLTTLGEGLNQPVSVPAANSTATVPPNVSNETVAFWNGSLGSSYREEVLFQASMGVTQTDDVAIVPNQELGGPLQQEDIDRKGFASVEAFPSSGSFVTKQIRMDASHAVDDSNWQCFDDEESFQYQQDSCSESKCVDNTPRCYIPNKPTDMDVLFGRGDGHHQKPGNKSYLALVKGWQPHYKMKGTCNKEKRRIVQHVVNTIHHRGGRFMKFDDKVHKQWYIADPKAVTQKVAQCLRQNHTKAYRQAARVVHAQKHKAC